MKAACERPQQSGRSLSQWDCAELARQLVEQGLVTTISPATIRRKLAQHKLKPWRHHLWLSPKVARDEFFAARVGEINELYTRQLGPHEVVLCLDEKTSLQPRCRLRPTLPAQVGKPNRLEAEYERKGALNLLAAFDTRSGRVYAHTAPRKRQVEFIAFLTQLETELDPSHERVYLVMDNVPMHKGQLVQEWLGEHPRFVCQFVPVHCSWMNQVEQWFSVLQRKRFTIADFGSLEELAAQLDLFVKQWNARAHAFKWTSQSFDKVLAKCEQLTLQAAA